MPRTTIRARTFDIGSEEAWDAALNHLLGDLSAQKAVGDRACIITDPGGGRRPKEESPRGHDRTRTIKRTYSRFWVNK